MPETLRSLSLPATPSNTGKGGGLNPGEEQEAGLSVPAVVPSFILIFRRSFRGTISHPKNLPGWRWQLGASMWCQLLRRGDLGFHQDSGSQNGEGLFE